MENQVADKVESRKGPPNGSYKLRLDMVNAYRDAHPDLTTSQCCAELGIRPVDYRNAAFYYSRRRKLRIAKTRKKNGTAAKRRKRRGKPQPSLAKARQIVGPKSKVRLPEPVLDATTRSVVLRFTDIDAYFSFLESLRLAGVIE